MMRYNAVRGSDEQVCNMITIFRQLPQIPTAKGRAMTRHAVRVAAGWQTGVPASVRTCARAHGHHARMGDEAAVGRGRQGGVAQQHSPGTAHGAQGGSMRARTFDVGASSDGDTFLVTKDHACKPGQDKVANGFESLRWHRYPSRIL